MDKKNAINNKGNKYRITIRLDKDILNWFNSLSPEGKGYQTRINYALREYMKNNGDPMDVIIRKIFREELNDILNVKKPI